MELGALLLAGAHRGILLSDGTDPRVTACISTLLSLYNKLKSIEDHIPHSQMIKGMNFRRKNFTRVQSVKRLYLKR